MSPTTPSGPAEPPQPTDPAEVSESGRTNDAAEGTAPGTARAFGSEPPLKEPAQPGPDETPDDAAMAPADVGVSTTRRGEDVIKEEGEEAGREKTEADASPSGRPAGESSPRLATGVKAPEDPDTAAPHAP
ncbi:hypothetical protein [Arthrobacter sp. NPDC058192]|uniref:hypothetical protein n=1 Tax=Arthrobacter sp. NPDC058192 TaxID=3346372 RepID=UPI0036E82635